MIRTPANGVAQGFSGIGNTDRLKRHESRRRTMAQVAGHLSVLALEQQYRSCTDVTAARHCQTIWLLAKGHDLAEAGWQDVVNETDKLPILVAAATAFDAWCQIAPLQHAGWMGVVLVSALL